MPGSYLVDAQHTSEDCTAICTECPLGPQWGSRAAAVAVQGSRPRAEGSRKLLYSMTHTHTHETGHFSPFRLDARRGLASRSGSHGIGYGSNSHLVDLSRTCRRLRKDDWSL